MSTQSIICPHCKKEIELSDALSHQLEERLLVEKKKMWPQALRAAEEKFKRESANELKLLKEQLLEERKKREEAQKAELELRRERVKLEEEKKEFELKVQREIDKERKKVSEEAYKKALDEYRFKEKETEKKLQDALRANEELRRKLEQGSQQLQGEVLELELEQVLRSEFPYDEVSEVPKGITGADVLQYVRDSRGRRCGTIIWESKRTKAWSDGWIIKLKTDKRTVKADLAVLVSEVLPKGVKNFAAKDGVWISNFASVVGLATVLRLNLIQLSAAKESAVNKNEKMELLYRYLTGVEFAQRVEAMVDAFSAMHEDLEKEKRAYIKIWAKREKQIQAMISNIVGMRGDLEGIVGGALPSIKKLELPSGK